jgi:predicted AAA+ superfamily ATPase
MSRAVRETTSRLRNAAFLSGPRKVGKKTLLRQQPPPTTKFDLLGWTLPTELTLRPWYCANRCWI